MKFFTTLLFFFAFILFFNFKPHEIPVTIQFNYDKNITFEKGTITIKETNQILEIKSLKDITIPLKKGKYTFIFNSENYRDVWISKKINEKNNVINVFLIENKSLEISNSVPQGTLLQLENGTANFINFGLGIQDFSEFKKKYGIGNSNQGCVISGNLAADATKNNQIIADYLDKKFGEVWREDLPFLPFGLAKK